MKMIRTAFVCTLTLLTGYVAWLSKLQKQVLIVTKSHTGAAFVGRIIIPSSASNGSADFRCVTARIFNMQFPVCTYITAVDNTVSGAFLRNGYFERDMVLTILFVLSSDPSLQFVDIGANIGTYTLPASRLTKVVSVEPNKNTMARLAHSVLLGNVTPNVTLVANAVSNHRMSVSLANVDKPGGTALEHNTTCVGIYATDCVETILLDDLLPLMTYRRTALKIDVEGHEINAFTEKTAARFFDAIDVAIILMEWGFYLHAKEPARVDTFVLFFLTRGYTVYSTDGQLLGLDWKKWPGNIILKKNYHRTA